eukprot:CAMPEP_0114603430 /NCGR_PEP_ID=MMETSP0168-20121206/18_1 /TAXON_ID=95228 ORGANISM="Vannella sp., Strain DIVA3 517/6/12" /NCGR_SAMPLE_ID=MMETSP0168 /ASSEMBLY_ACC=CAM_ASM_000044 /LENGTH=83 /DNA_ID=CAMNT_0001814215 /DNA_START=35 /DNA_END=286 /DNA_ORIENTATION=-
MRLIAGAVALRIVRMCVCSCDDNVAEAGVDWNQAGGGCCNAAGEVSVEDLKLREKAPRHVLVVLLIDIGHERAVLEEKKCHRE